MQLPLCGTMWRPSGKVPWVRPNQSCPNPSYPTGHWAPTRAGDGAGGAGGGAGVKGRGRRGGTAACRARVGGLISRAAEEAVLQSPQRADAGGGLILQHAQHQVLEAEVVGGAVARLPRPPAPGPARLHAQHLLQPPCPGALVILAGRGWEGGQESGRQWAGGAGRHTRGNRSTREKVEREKLRRVVGWAGETGWAGEEGKDRRGGEERMGRHKGKEAGREGAPSVRE